MQQEQSITVAVNTAEKQQRGFQPGQSGNPKGRPKGSRNKVTLAAQELLDGEAENITRRCIDMALNGNIPALKLCLERICPPRRERPLAVKLPKVKTAQDLPKVTAALLNAVAAGEVDPSQATDIAALIAAHGRALQTVEIERKISALAESGAVNICWTPSPPREVLRELLEQAGAGEPLSDDE